MMAFSDITPGLRLEVFVPEDWAAGKIKEGPQLLSETPRVVLFGGVASPGQRILVELRYAMVEQAGAAALFERLARARHGATLVKRSPAPAISSLFVEYERGGSETFIERITSGRNLAVSVFATTVKNQPLLDELQALLTRTTIGIDG
jgi:hypothetical protein